MRGALAAISLISLIPNFVDISRFETLRALHVVFWSWQHVLEDLGQVIGRLPLVPEISFLYMTVLIIYLNLYLPGAFALVWKTRHWSEVRAVGKG